jgi:hypothetical protein
MEMCHDYHYLDIMSVVITESKTKTKVNDASSSLRKQEIIVSVLEIHASQYIPGIFCSKVQPGASGSHL